MTKVEGKQHLAFNVSTKTQFIESQSDLATSQYVFSYTITIENKGEHAAQLIARRWLITDGDGETSTVEGEGVVGQQPVIPPGKSYTYTSGSVFKTPFGMMQGQYQMRDNNDQLFMIDIPLFKLSTPNLIN